MEEPGRQYTEQNKPHKDKHCMVPCAELSRSVVSDSATPWTVAHQIPLSMGILQARILESGAMPSSRQSSQPRNRTQVSRNTGRFFTIWATREAHTWNLWKKKESESQKVESWCQELEERWGNGNTLVKGHKLSAVRWVTAEDLLYTTYWL